MTIEQITAINNAMSMLSTISDAAECIHSVERFKEHVDFHIKALKDAGVHRYIIEHCKDLCDSWVPVVKQAEIEYKRRKAILEEEQQEVSLMENLAALQELKAKLNS